MELFVINRYDEVKNTPEKQKDKEKKLLEKIAKNIEKKKREKSEKTDVTENFIEESQKIVAADENIGSEKKKNKKAKRQREEEPAESEENVSKKVKIPDQEDEIPKQNNFTVLGDQVFEDLSAVDSILPYWLAYPEILSKDLSQKGIACNDVDYLSETLKKNLKTMGIKNFFPVQEKLIPFILNARNKPLPFRPQDLCVSSPTGTGKTLAYAVPIMENLLANRVECKVRALIILPVNELAKQVYNVFYKLCNNVKVRCVLLSKNKTLEQEQSLLVEYDEYNKRFNSKCDIIVTTGGRLVEHLFYTKGFSLKNLKFLVIDEADHAMAQTQNDWYYHLIQHLEIQNELQSNRLSYRDLIASVNEDGDYKIPQKLLFSATLSQDPEKINIFNLFQPKLFTTVESKEELMKYKERKEKEVIEGQEERRGQFMGKYTTPAELTEQYCITEYKLKPLTLFGLIKQHNWRKFLCFTNTVEGSHRLSFVLQTLCGSELVIEELSSFLPMKIRQKVLQKFVEGKVHGLICTDALSRGIDVPNVDAVISYDLPKILKVYIHRVGRTGRAGQKGTAVTIIAPDQIKIFEVREVVLNL